MNRALFASAALWLALAPASAQTFGPMQPSPGAPTWHYTTLTGSGSYTPVTNKVWVSGTGQGGCGGGGQASASTAGGGGGGGGANAAGGVGGSPFVTFAEWY